MAEYADFETIISDQSIFRITADSKQWENRETKKWLSEKKRRKLQQQDVDVRRRIELLQDFSMPHVSNLVKVTKDSQYIIAAGTYKPRLRVYDTNQMALKYEKAMDSHAVQLVCLEEDYSKVVILQDDRYIEFQHRYGMIFRTRIPKFGRDLSYHFPSCDLYIAAYGDEVYRLNLEQGKFLNSIKTSSNEVTCCEFNPEHQLFTCGTGHGQVECWDPRTRFRVGLLDCALASYQESDIEAVPKVTSLKYKDGLNLGVGTSSGQILLYDMRSMKPYLVKDHQYDLPIKSIIFQQKEDIVLSMDKRIVKMWDRNTGKAYTHIEPEETSLNDLCVMPGTGLLFMANEAPKILSYYIPSLGPAPKWCSFLDNITEELEETYTPQVYDDYKFVTRAELEEMNLSQLIGSSLLRAYMHGFFMDIRLYKKTKGISEPFAYNDYRKKKIRQKIEEERVDRVQPKYKLPSVNKELAQKILESDKAGGLLKDDRFTSLFNDPDFAIDKDSREYRMIHHNVTRIDEKAKKKAAKITERFEEVADADITSNKKSKKTAAEDDSVKKAKFFEIKEGDSLKDLTTKPVKHKKTKLPLEERIAALDSKSDTIKYNSGFGAKEMTFMTSADEKTKKRKQEQDLHRKERAKLRRSAEKITKHKIAPMWKPQT